MSWKGSGILCCWLSMMPTWALGEELQEGGKGECSVGEIINTWAIKSTASQLQKEKKTT